MSEEIKKTEVENPEAETVIKKEYDKITAQFQSQSEELELLKKKIAESEKHKKEEEKKAKESAEQAAKQKGDIESLEKSWNDKLSAAIAEKDEINERNQRMLITMSRDREARLIAESIAIDGSAAVLVPHIKNRLSMEIDEDKELVSVKVLDDMGKLSAMSLDDLKEEFKRNKAFAPIIKGTSASGGGGVEQSKNASGRKVIKRVEFDKMDQLQRADFIMKHGGIVED